MYFGQAEQDKFVLNVLKGKKNGYFLEIGSRDAIEINNSYLLETKYDWKGIMVEIDSQYLSSYIEHRPNSVHIINDATQVDYKKVFEENNAPLSFDYLQIDLEVNNGSTLMTLYKLDNEIFETYKFATVTFEHDIYNGNFTNTRLESRNIFKKRGYICVFEDINNRDEHTNQDEHTNLYPYEDWYVHPDLVDMNYVNNLIENNRTNYVNYPLTEKTLYWKDIQYPSI